MAFYSVDGMIGAQAVTSTDTVQHHPLGTVIDIQDPALGKGRAIYLRGVASTAVGDAVVFDENFQTTRAVAASRGPVAIALSANVANQYGWYQIEGLAVVNGTGTLTADSRVYLSSTAGALTTTVTASQAIDGMRSQSALGTPAAGQAYVLMFGAAANGNG